MQVRFYTPFKPDSTNRLAPRGEVLRAMGPVLIGPLSSTCLSALRALSVATSIRLGILARRLTHMTRSLRSPTCAMRAQLYVRLGATHTYHVHSVLACHKNGSCTPLSNDIQYLGPNIGQLRLNSLSIWRILANLEGPLPPLRPCRSVVHGDRSGVTLWLVEPGGVSRPQSARSARRLLGALGAPTFGARRICLRVRARCGARCHDQSNGK